MQKKRIGDSAGGVTRMTMRRICGEKRERESDRMGNKAHAQGGAVTSGERLGRAHQRPGKSTVSEFHQSHKRVGKVSASVGQAATRGAEQRASPTSGTAALVPEPTRGYRLGFRSVLQQNERHHGHTKWPMRARKGRGGGKEVPRAGARKRFIVVVPLTIFALQLVRAEPTKLLQRRGREGGGC